MPNPRNHWSPKPLDELSSKLVWPLLIGMLLGVASFFGYVVGTFTAQTQCPPAPSAFEESMYP